MEHTELLALYDRYQRIEIDYPDVRREVFPRVVRLLRPAPGSSTVIYSRLDPADAEAEIDAQLAYFQQNRQPFSWKVLEHDTPPDLKERLAARGLEVSGPFAVLALDLDGAPAELLRPPLDLVQPGLRAELRPVSAPEQLGEVEHVLSQVWPGSFAWIHERLGGHLAVPGFLSITVAYVDGQPASVGWAYFHANNPFAHLYGGSTVPAWRGRGLYTALLAARAQEARRRGCRFLAIDAGPESAPIAQKHGFRLLARSWDCDWEPG